MATANNSGSICIVKPVTIAPTTIEIAVADFQSGSLLRCGGLNFSKNSNGLASKRLRKASIFFAVESRRAKECYLLSASHSVCGRYINAPSLFVTPSLSLLKFDKIWLFFDFNGAGQRGLFLWKRAAWVSWWCPEEYGSHCVSRGEHGSTLAG
jgi:hypothetical protein